MSLEDRTKIYSTSYTNVFKAVLDYLGSEGYAIQTIDKEFGIIQTDYKSRGGILKEGRIKLDFNLSKFAQDVELENHYKSITARKITNWTIMESEIQFDSQLDLSQVASASMLKKVDLDIDDIRYRLILLEEFLGEIENTDLRLKNIFPHLYSEYISPEIIIARKNLIKSMHLNT